MNTEVVKFNRYMSFFLLHNAAYILVTLLKINNLLDSCFRGNDNFLFFVNISLYFTKSVLGE